MSVVRETVIMSVAHAQQFPGYSKKEQQPVRERSRRRPDVVRIPWSEFGFSTAHDVDWAPRLTVLAPSKAAQVPSSRKNIACLAP